jgi:hypothetical protein
MSTKTNKIVTEYPISAKLFTIYLATWPSSQQNIEGGFMKKTVWKVLTAIVATWMFATPSSDTRAQTLDQKAWNHVWDRLGEWLGGNAAPFESIHVLKVVVPTTWVNRNVASLKELERYAGAIPEKQFTMDPSRLQRPLHKIYQRFVLEAELPEQTDAQRTAFNNATDDWQAAADEFEKVRDQFEDRWIKHAEDLKRRGEPIDTQAKNDFLVTNGFRFTKVINRLDAAEAVLHKVTPPDGHWIRALLQLRAEMNAYLVKGADATATYYGGEATLKDMKECDPVSKVGWETMTFGQTTSSYVNRSSSWNGNGAWQGAFFSVRGGGGGQNYESTIKSASERVSMRFCNVRYIPLAAGNWLDISFLQAIDNGTIRLRKESSAAKELAGGKKIFGENGLIPRIVKGAIVARSMAFEAQLESTLLNEVSSNSGGNAGIRIGPFSIGGGGGSRFFSRDYKAEQGGYARWTDSTVPLIFAVVTEPTK